MNTLKMHISYIRSVRLSLYVCFVMLRELKIILWKAHGRIEVYEFNSPNVYNKILLRFECPNASYK